ncbi:MAG TPA: hypothetical protein VF092_15550 [Longimicrobium sp.]
MTVARKAALLCGASLLLLGAQFDCWGAVDAYDRYPLSRCPDSAFALPAAIDLPPYRFTKGGERARHWWSSPPPTARCNGFAVYTLGRAREFPPGADSLSGPAAIYQADVRLNRGPSCSLDVGYGYLGAPHRLGPAEDRAREGARDIRWSAAIARGVVAGTGIEVHPSAEPHRFTDWKERDRWCAASAGDSAAK